MSVPDPLEQAAEAVELVSLTKSDFEMLEAAINAVQEDVARLAALLKVRPPDGMDPHTVMVTMLLPKVVELVHTQREVDKASDQIKTAAARFGNKTIEHNGVKGLKVGQKIPGLFNKPRG